jgi:hypothetical protein
LHEGYCLSRLMGSRYQAAAQLSRSSMTTRHTMSVSSLGQKFLVFQEEHEEGGLCRTHVK